MAVRWKGAAQLRSLLVPVGELSTHPDNPRRGNLDLIAESLRTHGQLKPLVANCAKWRLELSRYPTIVAGNHTLMAADERLRWPEIAVVQVKLSGVQERQYLIADNRTADVAEYHAETLTKILAELADAGKLEGTGYRAEEVEAMVAEMDRIARSAEREPRQTKMSTRHVGRSAIEVRLLFDPDRAGRLNEYLRVLGKEWGRDLPREELVFRAIEEAARAQ